MIVFDRPISRFTAIDLMTLFACGGGAHRDGPDGDSLLVIAADRGRGW